MQSIWFIDTEFFEIKYSVIKLGANIFRTLKKALHLHFDSCLIVSKN